MKFRFIGLILLQFVVTNFQIFSSPSAQFTPSKLQTTQSKLSVSTPVKISGIENISPVPFTSPGCSLMNMSGLCLLSPAGNPTSGHNHSMFSPSALTNCSCSSSSSSSSSMCSYCSQQSSGGATSVASNISGTTNSSFASSSVQSPRPLKRKPDQSAHNDKCLRYIDERIQSGKMTPSEIQKLQRRTYEMKDTSRKTKQSATEQVLVATVESLGSNDVEEKNDHLGKILNSPTSSHGVYIRNNILKVGSDVKRFASHLDTAHVSMPTIHQNKISGEVEKVDGGHNLSNYNISDIATPNEFDCFVDKKGVLGFFVASKVAKTALPNFTAKDALENLQNGNTFAQGKGSSKIVLTQTQNNEFVASYTDKQNPAIQTTQYPVLTINADETDSAGHVIVGHFGKIKTDLSGADRIRSILLPRVALKNMINQGISLDSKNPNIKVADISGSINQCSQSPLAKMGAPVIPGNIYGYYKIS